MEREVGPISFPREVLTLPPAGAADFLPFAATLAGLYARNRHHYIWTRYIWTCDLDRHGQRVYVGDNGRGLEIHRHLHLTDRWGVISWS